MLQFEVGKVYANSVWRLGGSVAGDEYIRIKKRSETAVVFEFVNKDGSTYTLDYKFKKIKPCDGIEEIHLNELWRTYSAKFEVKYFEKLVSDHIEQEKERIKKENERKEAIISAKVAEVETFLKDRKISAFILEEILDKFYNLDDEVIRRLKGEENG